MMPIEAIIEWGITLFIFALCVGVVALAPWKPPVPPKNEPERFPAATDGQGIIDAMNGLESLLDWHRGNTDVNVIIDDIKWQLFTKAISEYNILPIFNQKTGKWVEFDGTFRLCDTIDWRK